MAYVYATIKRNLLIAHVKYWKNISLPWPVWHNLSYPTQHYWKIGLNRRAWLIFILGRHHLCEKRGGGPKSVEITEIGPRFEMRLYKVRPKVDVFDQCKKKHYYSLTIFCPDAWILDNTRNCWAKWSPDWVGIETLHEHNQQKNCPLKSVAYLPRPSDKYIIFTICMLGLYICWGSGIIIFEVRFIPLFCIIIME